MAGRIDLSNVPASATGVIHVDLAELKRNWQAMRDLVHPVECASVVKADAYGLGANHVIPCLHQAGCQSFFVATPREAHQTRKLVPTSDIYVLDGLMPGTADALGQLNAVPVLSSAAEVEDWAKYAQQCGKPLKAALHIDTGLNRLGVSPGDVQSVQESGLLAHLDLHLVMSHLACADEPYHAQNENQLSAWNAAVSGLANTKTSLAASDGALLGPAFRLKMVRPGYAIYGGQASQGPTAPVKPVVSVHARVLQVRDVPPGGTVGYSATFQAMRPMRIATIAAGYADGVFRAASATNDVKGGSVAFEGELAPIVGRVSMDLITVDITDHTKPDAIVRGAWAELIGPNLPLETVGQGAGTIGYEVLTNLSRRFHRVYLNDTTPEPAS